MKETGAQIRSPPVEIAHCGLIATDPCPPAPPPGHVVTTPAGEQCGPNWLRLSWPGGFARGLARGRVRLAPSYVSRVASR